MNGVKFKVNLDLTNRFFHLSDFLEGRNVTFQKSEQRLFIRLQILTVGSILIPDTVTENPFSDHPPNLMLYKCLQSVTWNPGTASKMAWLGFRCPHAYKKCAIWCLKSKYREFGDKQNATFRLPEHFHDCYVWSRIGFLKYVFLNKLTYKLYSPLPSSSDYKLERKTRNGNL